MPTSIAMPDVEPLTSGHRGSIADTVDTKSVATYQVAIYTGTPPGAGTDGNVWVWFDGVAGRSGWLYCDNSADNFENGHTDYFYFNLPNLGALTAAWVYFDPLGGGSSAWFLANVVINGTYFTCNKWLTTKGMTRLDPA